MRQVNRQTNKPTPPEVWVVLFLGVAFVMLMLLLREWNRALVMSFLMGTFGLGMTPASRLINGLSHAQRLAGMLGLLAALILCLWALGEALWIVFYWLAMLFAGCVWLFVVIRKEGWTDSSVGHA